MSPRALCPLGAPVTPAITVPAVRSRALCPLGALVTPAVAVLGAPP